MSALTAHEIAALIRDAAMTLTVNQPINGYEIELDGETENVWVIAQADFDYEHGALLQLLTDSHRSRPYIMVWWYTDHIWSGEDDDLGQHISKTEVEWIHNHDDSVSWGEAISKWGSWIAVLREDRA